VRPILLREYFRSIPPNAWQAATELGRFRDDVEAMFRRLRFLTVSGTITVSGLTVGQSVDVAVDHSSDGIYCLAEYPRFAVVDGVDVLVYALLDIGGTGKATNGSAFAVRITNVSKEDYSPTFSLAWTRQGIRQ